MLLVLTLAWGLYLTQYPIKRSIPVQISCALTTTCMKIASMDGREW
jgi:hypothetical protein